MKHALRIDFSVHQSLDGLILMSVIYSVSEDFATQKHYIQFYKHF